jgi:hypothetical protein
MSNFKDQLIRLGNKNPELRKHLRPVLDRISSRGIEEAIDSYDQEDLISSLEQMGVDCDTHPKSGPVHVPGYGTVESTGSEWLVNGMPVDGNTLKRELREVSQMT